MLSSDTLGWRFDDLGSDDWNEIRSLAVDAVAAFDEAYGGARMDRFDDAGYSRIPVLENLFFEDSWVLEFVRHTDGIMFRVDAVLTESHPAFAPPQPGEQHCYRRGELVFDSIRSLRWEADGLVRASIDPSGETDLGSIDSFVKVGETYIVVGDFGTLTIESEAPFFSIGPAEGER